MNVKVVHITSLGRTQYMFRQYTYYAARNGIKFSMGAVTVDPMSSAYDPRPLIPYLQQLGTRLVI